MIGLFNYSHIEKLGGKEQVQAFTAIGKVLDDKVYQYEMSPGFVPFRRNVRFVEEFEEILIKPLIYELDFIEDKQFWGQKFKYGHLPPAINADFISAVMGNSKVEEKVKINSEGKIVSLEMKVTK